MKKQNLLFFPFLFMMGFVLFSCNVGNNGNTTNLGNVPAVVTDNTVNGAELGTPYGYLVSPELVTLIPGECVYLQQFTIDYDNQPSNQYTTITNVVQFDVNQSYVEQNDTVNIMDSSLPISSVNGVASAYYGGNFFVLANAKDKSPSFRLVYNNTKDAADGTKNLYLLATPSSSGSSSSDITSINAFNLLPLIQNYGRDTTVAVTSGSTASVNLRYIMVNLNYLSAISDTGIPTYSAASQQNPFMISIFK